MKRPNTKQSITKSYTEPSGSLTRLALATLSVMSSLSAGAATGNIGDLEIYQKAQGEKGTAIIAMMLDTSGSMVLIDPKLPTVGVKVFSGHNWLGQPLYNKLILDNTPSYQNHWPYSCVSGNRQGNQIVNQQTHMVKDYTVSNDITDARGKKVGSVSYTITGCATNNHGLTLKKTSNGYEISGGEANRLSNLKVGLISLLADGTKLDEKNQIGLGRFSVPSNRYVASMDIPVEKLTVEHRKKLINYVKTLQAHNATPSANAYAEVGAYMLGTSTSTSMSGFGYSSRDTKHGNSYKSPIKAQKQKQNQCGADGYGIFFLTDGLPNTAYQQTADSMTASLRGSSLSVSRSGTNDLSIYGTESQWQSGWQYIGAYAKHLRNPHNPKRQEIRTATVGFGGDFKGFRTKTIKVSDASSPTGFKDKIIPDCQSAPSTDAKNLCLWGEYPGKIGNMSTGGLGNGGFTSTSSATALANAVTDFLGDLTADNDISALPAGSITIPDDPYSIASQQPIAYLPMIQPDLVSHKSAWQGNLKKYNIENGTFYGRNRTRLYAESNRTGQIKGISLNPAAIDLWSTTRTNTKNNQIISGGVYSNLKKPNKHQPSQRTVFIEDTDTNNKTILRKFGVNSSGELMLDGQKISSVNKFKDTSTYTINVINHLLAFVGYNGMAANTDISKLGSIKVQQSGANPILGGVLHSTPSLVSYSATFDGTGNIVSGGRDDYLLFGSMNGALHMVNAKDQGNGDGGQEKLAIIPKVMLKNQPEALSMSNHAEEGRPKFGVDAPWLVVANHNYDYGSSKVTVSEQPTITITTNGKTTTQRAENRLGGMHAFGGFRMGAKGLYGIDLTNKDTPKIDFVITNSTSGFDRIGYIWNKPTPARIKMNASDKYGTDVLIFGGGYDICYEKEAFQVGENTGGATTGGANNCNSKSAADGNAVYIINAKTGDLIWSASSGSSNGNGAAGNNKYTKVDTMKNSIVGGIEVLDRNNDGFMDHLYFADLGGQVFRADFVNAKDNGSQFKNHRVIRVLNEDGDGKYKRRFYEKPVVDFHADGKNGTFGLVMVISGDRSSPLSTMRSSNEHADRLYGIFDYDLTKPSSQLYPKNNQNVILYAQDISAKQHLVELGNTNITKDDVRSKIINDGKKGWYHPLQYFEGYKNALYTKGMGGSEIVRGRLPNHVEKSYLYTTVYNPDMRYAESNTCSAQVRGGSERQFYCLPYGVCDNNLLAGYQRAGMGIQQLAFAPSGSNNKRTRVLISSMLATEHTANSYGTNLGGKGLFEKTLNSSGQVSQNQLTKRELNPGPGYGMQNSFSLTPQRWYDLSATN